MQHVASDHVARLAARLLDTSGALVFALDERGDASEAAHGLQAEDAAILAALCARATRQRETLVLGAPGEEASASGIAFQAAAPLLGQHGDVLGAIGVLDRRPRPDMGAEQIQALQDFAAMAALVLAAQPPPARAAEAGDAAALRDRLKALAVEAAGYDAAVQAVTRAVCEAAGGMLCTLHRLGADGETLQFVGGCASPVLGGTERLDAIRALPLTTADPLVGTAVREGRSVTLVDAGARDVPRHALLGAAACGPLALAATPLRIGEERCALVLA
uniref:GAF domain-containing protein n=1 Tax=Falsiroseomonas oryzae TaxID=2766473 RepID=UPI0022EB47C6